MSRYRFTIMFSALFALLVFAAEVGQGGLNSGLQVPAPMANILLCYLAAILSLSGYSQILHLVYPAHLIGLVIALYGGFGGWFRWFVDWLRRQNESKN